MSLDLNTICSLRKRQQILSYPLNRLEISSPYKNTSYTSNQLAMKRKAQILKYQTKDKNQSTSSENWSLINKQTNSKTTFENRKIEPIYHRDINTFVNYITPPFVDYTTCPNSNSIIFTPTNKSDVPGPVIDLYDDPNVPLHMYNDIRVFGIEEPDDIIHMNYIYNADYFLANNTLTDIYIHYVLANSKELTTETFNVTIPISFYFNASVIPSTSGGVPNGTHISVDQALITLTNVSFRIVYNDTTLTTGETVSVSHLTDKNYAFDISFNKKSDTDTFTAIKYIGTINITNINITTIPGFIYDMKLLANFSYGVPTEFNNYFQNITVGAYVFTSESNKLIEHNVKFTDNNVLPDQIDKFNVVSNTNTTKGLLRMLNAPPPTTNSDYIPEVNFTFENIILTQYVKVEIDKYERLVFRNTKPDSILSNANRIVTPLQYKAGRKYFLTDGDYYFVGIPVDNPLTILNNGNSNLIVTTFNSFVSRASFSSEYSNYIPISYETNDIQVVNSVNDGKYTFYTGSIKVSIKGNFGSASFRSLNNGYLEAVDVLHYYSSIPPSLTNNIFCLFQTQDNIVNIINKNTTPKYIFNSQTTYDDNGFIGLCVGKYKFINIPNEYAIGFDISNTSAFNINNNYTPLFTNANNVKFYSGSIEFTVHSDFGIVDYMSINNGYMGGHNKIIFNRSCPPRLFSDAYVNLPYSYAMQCLKIHNVNQIPININDNVISIEKYNGNKFLFNDISFSTYEKISMQNGSYKFIVPTEHPIGFDISSTVTNIDISGSNLVGSPTNTSLNQTSSLLNNIQHYTGEVYLIINGPFNDFSYHCLNHGYMGGYLRITYSTSCASGGSVTNSSYSTDPSSSGSSGTSSSSGDSSSSGSGDSSSSSSGGSSSSSSGSSSSSSGGSSSSGSSGSSSSGSGGSYSY